MMKYKYIGEHPTVMLVGESLATITKGDMINLVGAPSPDFVLQEKIKTKKAYHGRQGKNRTCP